MYYLQDYIAGLISKEGQADQSVAWPSDCITLQKLANQANKQCGLVGTPQVDSSYY